MRRREVEIYPEERLVIYKVRKPLYWLNEREFKFYIRRDLLRKFINFNLVLEIEVEGKKRYTKMEAIEDILRSKDIMFKAFLYPNRPLVLIGYIYILQEAKVGIKKEN